VSWFVYIIETRRKSLYTGITTNVNKRFARHKNGTGAKFFRIEVPKRVVYTETFDSKGGALRREAEIKGLSPAEKRKLCSPSR
jgi:putative endonuclease